MASFAQTIYTSLQRISKSEGFGVWNARSKRQKTPKTLYLKERRKGRDELNEPFELH